MNKCFTCRWFGVCGKDTYSYSTTGCQNYEEEKEDISESKSELRRISIMKDLDLE